MESGQSGTPVPTRCKPFACGEKVRQVGAKSRFSWADVDNIHDGKVDEKNCFVQRVYKTSLGIVYVATDI